MAETEGEMEGDNDLTLRVYTAMFCSRFCLPCDPDY